MVVSSHSDDRSLSLRALALLGGLSLLLFEAIYYWLGEQTGPLWLRLLLVGACLTYFGAMQVNLPLRRYADHGAAMLAILVTVENVFRMYLVDFRITHSVPMLIVLAGASYAFTTQRLITIYLVMASTALTGAILTTPNPQVSPYMYIPTVWVLSILTFMVFGTRLQEHSKTLTQERILNGICFKEFRQLLKALSYSVVTVKLLRN